MIYFIKDTVTLAIKIGFSNKPKSRVGDLQTGNPSKLILLGTVTGTRDHEDGFHARFAHHRLEGEWFKGEIIEDVLAIIAQHKEQRLVIRRRTMADTASGDGEGGESVPVVAGSETAPVDSDSGIRGICRIPDLKLKSFSLKLTERPDEPPNDPRGFSHQPKGCVFCGFELRYLLEFTTNVTNDFETQRADLQKLRSAILAPTSQDKGLWHTFFDEDNAVIPFRPLPADCHIVGGGDAITGDQGDAFRVLVAFEKMLNPNCPNVKIKDVFMGENYTGEHPLKKATKLVVSLR